MDTIEPIGSRKSKSFWENRKLRMKVWLTTLAVMTPLVISGAAIKNKNLIAKEKQLREICNAPEATPISYKITQQSLDQIFRDTYGYRLYSHTETGQVREEFYSDGKLVPFPMFPKADQFKGMDQHQRVVIFKDLAVGEQAYFKKLEFTVPNCVDEQPKSLESKLRPFYFVEVHLPTNQGLAPGITDYDAGKVQYHQNMTEVK